MIYIWIRRTLDWASEDAPLQIDDPWLRPKIPLWDATFTMSYSRFRHRVAQIADANHAEVEGATVARWDEIPEGAVVLPVDDDDWFAPGAARAVEAALDPEAAGYLWPSRWIEVPFDLGHRLYLWRHRVVPSLPPKWICSTNNYAFLKGPGAKELLGSHVKASRWVEAHRDAMAPVPAGGLSIANRTLASQTTLSQRRMTLRRSELVRKYRRHRHLYDRPLPADLAWAEPYVRQMGELMAELELR